MISQFKARVLLYWNLDNNEANVISDIPKAWTNLWTEWKGIDLKLDSHKSI
jgi:hypothetical protein